MADYWPEILTSRSFYNTRSNLTMHWWPCPSTEKTTVLSSTTTSKGLKNLVLILQCEGPQWFFLSNYFFPCHHQTMTRPSKAASQGQSSLCQALRGWSQQLHHACLVCLLCLHPQPEKQYLSGDNLMSNPRKSEQILTTLFTINCVPSFGSLPKPFQCYLHHVR